MKLKSKVNLGWSLLFFGLLFYQILEYFKANNKLCLDVPLLLFEEQHCFSDSTFWFLVIAFCYIGPGVYFLINAFKPRK